MFIINEVQPLHFTLEWYLACNIACVKVDYIQLQDVAAFLEEMETTEVLLDAVLKSQNSRVTVSAQLNLFLTERKRSKALVKWSRR